MPLKENEFYYLKTKQYVTLPADKICVRVTARGGYQAFGKTDEGDTVLKFISSEHAKKFKTCSKTAFKKKSKRKTVKKSKRKTVKKTKRKTVKKTKRKKTKGGGEEDNDEDNT